MAKKVKRKSSSKKTASKRSKSNLDVINAAGFDKIIQKSAYNAILETIRKNRSVKIYPSQLSGDEEQKPQNIRTASAFKKLYIANSISTPSFRSIPIKKRAR